MFDVELQYRINDVKTRIFCLTRELEELELLKTLHPRARFQRKLYETIIDEEFDLAEEMMQTKNLTIRDAIYELGEDKDSLVTRAAQEASMGYWNLYTFLRKHGYTLEELTSSSYTIRPSYGDDEEIFDFKSSPDWVNVEKGIGGLTDRSIG